jgi:asparagine synthase (glutamine-hydrolysing)
MCGIAGYFNTDGEPASAVVLKRMTDVIAHRGPDGEGFYTDGFVALGHRRLAIIDLSPLGHQPMATPDGRYFLTYNGEVYNFHELRVELEAKGHTFRSRTDSEVVLHAYAEWGAACVHRFNGMFAFAVWDKVKLELFLARDRYGVKPLYYCFVGNTIVFGSESKALLAHPSVSRGLDQEALVEYFAFQNFFTDRTLFENIRILPAGCTLTTSLGKSDRPAPARYWDFEFRADESLRDERECVEELDRLLKQAVSRQLVSDVDVGAYLSGGMDSGTLTAIAATQLPYIRTFTCGFDLHSASGMELAFDEREKAELMSYRFKTEHYEMVLKAGDMERALPRLARHMEEPRVGQSYPNFYVAQLASKFVKVVLSGAGGDEMFAGYPWRYYRAIQSVGFEEWVAKYYEYWQRLLTADEAKRVFAPIWSRARNTSTRDIFESVFSGHREALPTAEEYVQRSLYLEAKTFLHGLLVIEDKLSMAHSLETRVPFLDNDLVDFAMRVPPRLKLAQIDRAVRADENDIARMKRTREGKMVLRQVMKRHIPAEIADGDKQGFSGPDGSWFRGESLAYVRRELVDGHPRIYAYLDRRAVTELIEQHLSGQVNRRLLIWSLLSFEWWLRTFLV